MFVNIIHQLEISLKMSQSTKSEFVKVFQSLSSKGGSHMRPRTNFVLALHGECLHSNTYKNAFICFEKHF